MPASSEPVILISADLFEEIEYATILETKENNPFVAVA